MTRRNRNATRAAALIAAMLIAALPLAAWTQASATKHRIAPAASSSAAHKARAKHHAREPRGQMAPAPERISEIQAALARENAYEGDPNGVWDAATIAAMKRFQTAQNLSPTGKIDAITLQRLGLGSDVAGKGAPTPQALPPAAPPATPSASIQGDDQLPQ